MHNPAFLLQCLLLFPSLVSAVAVAQPVPRGGANTRLDQEGMALVPDVGQDILEEKKSDAERIVLSQWGKHRRWAMVAKKRKTTVEVGRISKLVLVSVGAVAQVASTQLVKYKSHASIFGGICIGLGTYIKNKVLTEEKIDSMVASFETSQAIKTEVYKFRAQVTPYDQFSQKPDQASKELQERCKSISKNTDDEKFLTTSQDSKPAPGWLDTRDEYTEKRIDDMVNRFYRKRAKKLKKRVAFCSGCENALLTLSAAASFSSTQQLPAVLQNVVTSISGWGGALTTVSAAFANHLAKGKFNDIAREYFEAIDELQDLKDSWPSTAAMAGAPDWEKQVIKSEAVIFSTTESWAKAKSGK